MRKNFKLTKKKCFIQIGDILSEVRVTNAQCKIKKCNLENTIIQFEKNSMKNYYFSDYIDLQVEGKEKNYSSAGEICYFSLIKCIGISFDEDFSIGIPRFSLGRIFDNLLLFQSLLKVEKAEFFWIYSFSTELNNKKIE